MIYYILVIGVFISSFFDFIKGKEHLKFQIFVIWNVVFWFFKSLAWDTGTDFPQFYSVFEYSSWNNIFSYVRYGVGSELMEPGYVFLNVLIKTIFHSYIVFRLITNAFILYSFSYLILRFVPQYKITAFALMIISTEMFPVRQTLVTAILCFSYTFIVERKFKCYFISILIAFTIHRSTLILFPLYWIGRFKYSVKWFSIVYLGLVFSSRELVDFFSSLFDMSFFVTLTGGTASQYYINEDELVEVGLGGVFAALAHLILFGYVISINKIKKRWNEMSLNTFCNLYFVLICLNVIGTLPGLVIVYRMSNNFWIVYPLLLVISYDMIRVQLRYFGAIVGMTILCLGWSLRYERNPIFDSNGLYYEMCYYPYYSVFDSVDGRLIRSNPWPNFNK